MDKNTLARINGFTRREFSERELYVFPVILCDNDIDRDGERFSDEALESLRTLFIGKTGIFDHNPSTSNQSARIFDTEVVTDEGRLTKDRRIYKYLKGQAYMIRTADNASLIDEIDGGIKKEVSISCSASKQICSVCGCDRRETQCTHIRGKDYGNGECHFVLDGITDVYEWSFVAVPAQINAGVTKKYIPEKEEKSMKFTPINTQEEFEAAVKSRVDAAVADTEKRFEGWLSPEDAAVITKERDDTAAANAQLSAKNKEFELETLRMKAANEKGVPLELAGRLTGDTKEEILRDAESFAKYFSAPKFRPTPSFSAERAPMDNMNAAQLEMLHELGMN